MVKQCFYCRAGLTAWMFSMTLFCSSCYSYRIATQAQAGTEINRPVTAHSFFWGLLKSPKEIHTPICDSLGSTGLAEVNIKNNFGFALITVATLGIWSPVRIEWRCAKPPKKTGIL